MNWLDVLLVLAAASFAFSGYRQGFVVGVLAFAGFLGGGSAASSSRPGLVSGLEAGIAQSVLAISIVLLAGDDRPGRRWPGSARWSATG